MKDEITTGEQGNNLPSSAIEAKKVGSRTYFTGKMCSHGHTAPRRTSNGMCCECVSMHDAKRDKTIIREKAIARYWEDAEKYRLEKRMLRQMYPEKYREMDKQRYEKEKEKRLENARQYYQKNKSAVLDNNAKWREQHKSDISEYLKKNAHRYRPYAALRQEHIKRATPPWVDMKAIDGIYLEALSLQKSDGIPREVDHIIPLRGKLVSGLHVQNNLQILTQSENRRKNNSFVPG